MFVGSEEWTEMAPVRLLLSQTCPGESHVCDVCDKTFAHLSSLKSHRRVHTKPKVCLVCGRRFSSKSNLVGHSQIHRVWPKDPYVEQTYDQPETLELQNGEVAKIILRSFKCSFCNFEADSVKDVKLHLQTEHVNLKCFKCPKCETCIEDSDSLIAHFKSEHPEYVPSVESQTLLKCKYCPGKTFYTETELRQHNALILHGCNCTICGKELQSEKNLIKHIQNFHILNKKEAAGVNCGICGKTLKSQGYLKSHLLIHTEENPFKCLKCGAAFNRKDKLKRHELIHKKPKTFRCEICDKLFSRPDKVKEHQTAIHARNLKLKCNYCNEVFECQSDLKFHNKTIHPMPKPIKCFKCSKTFHWEKQRQQHHREKHGIIFKIAENEDMQPPI